MANERTQQPTGKDKPWNHPQPQPQPAGRTGQGSNSVIPHLRADQKARAVAKIAKRHNRDF